MSADRPLPFRAALAVAGATGFLALSYEILWFRALSYVTGGRAWTFGLLLGAYLLGLALAARACEELGTQHPDPGARHRAALAVSVVAACAVAYAVVPAAAFFAASLGWPVVLVLIGGAAGALGAAFPLAAHLAIAPDRAAGARLSILYLADILGSAAGGVFTGYLLLDWLPMRWANAALAVAGLVLGAVLFAAGRLPARMARVGVASALAAAIACVALAPALHDRLWERLMPFGGPTGQARFAEVVENRHGVIAVSSEGIVYGGGIFDGAFNVDPAERRNNIYRAYSVAAMHPAPRRVLLIGFGSGSWAQVLANLPGVERLTVVEINPGYVEVVRRHPEVASVLSNPRVELFIDDARRWLARHPDRRFEAIVSNSSYHWRENATNLLSVEFLALAKRHLSPGGIVFFNGTNAEEAKNTALAVFGNGQYVGTFFAASDAPMAWDVGALRRAVLAMRIDGGPVLHPERPEHRAWLEAVAVPPAVERPRPGAPVITDDNMLTEWSGYPWRR